jgi:hypothetical protein
MFKDFIILFCGVGSTGKEGWVGCMIGIANRLRPRLSWV